MPRFETPLPYSPDRTRVWPESVYSLRVDGLPTVADSDAIIQFTHDYHASLPDIPHTHVTFQPFGLTNWNTGARSGYFVDRLPAGTSTAFSSPARRTWTALNPDAQHPGKHLYFADLRQQGATKNLLTGEYTILPVFINTGPDGGADKHSVMWSPDLNELVESISYRGDRPESAHATTFITTDYEMPLGADGVRKAGANSPRVPIGPLFFTYQDLVDCGTTGDLGHVIGIAMKNGNADEVWPARANDFELAEGPSLGHILRLRADFDENQFTRSENRALIRTLKKHGMMIIDRGPTMRILACSDPTWPTGNTGLNADWGTKVQILDFEVVDVSGVKTDSFTRRYPLEPPAGKIRVGCAQTSGSIITKHETPTGQPLGMHRRYISDWAQRGNIASEIETSALAGRSLHLSIKTPNWAAVAAGNHDAEIDAMWNAIRDTFTCIWISFHHEPENDLNRGFGTATDWRNMQLKFEARRVARGATNAVVVPLLIDDTIPNGEGADWVIEDTSKFPIYGIDFYSNNYQTGPLDLRNNPRFYPNVNYLVSRGIDVCFPELGGAIDTFTERNPLFLEAFINEAVKPENRIKGYCWFDDGANQLGGVSSDPDGEVLAAFHASLVADYSYRGGAWRGNPTGVIDSIRVTDTTPEVTPPQTGEQTVRRKVAGEWVNYSLKRNVGGTWVTQRVKRIDTA